MKTRKNDWFSEEYLDLDSILSELCNKKILNYNTENYSKIKSPMDFTDKSGNNYHYTRDTQFKLDDAGMFVTVASRYELNSDEFSLHLNCEKLQLRPKELRGQAVSYEDIKHNDWLEHKSFLHTHGESNKVLNAILKYVHDKKLPDDYD